MNIDRKNYKWIWFNAIPYLALDLTEISSIFSFFRTYVAKPAASWMNDYIDRSGLPAVVADTWLRTVHRVHVPVRIFFCYKIDTILYIIYFSYFNLVQRTFASQVDAGSLCDVTLNEYNRPMPDDLDKYASFFLRDNLDETLVKGGDGSLCTHGVDYVTDLNTGILKSIPRFLRGSHQRVRELAFPRYSSRLESNRTKRWYLQPIGIR